MLQRAILHMHSAGKAEIDSGNVLAAMFRERDSHAIFLLERQGVSRLDVINYVSHGIEKVRSDGEGRPPVTDGPFAETKDLIAGWMIIDVDSQERAIELAGELSAAPGAGGRPIHEWLEVRPFLTEPPTVTQ